MHVVEDPRCGKLDALAVTMLRVSTAHSRPFGAAARPARLGRPLVGLVARASSGGPQQQQEAPPQASRLQMRIANRNCV